MPLRKDVYELLCLYQGPHPREAFKPRLQPTDWREREKVRLVFRTQVPDHLESAYDIALGEGFFEQHILEPNEQFSLYESHGIPLPAQNRPWKVFPANVDALVFITAKGHAALATAEPIENTSEPRIGVIAGGTPRKLLTGWRAIAAALDMKYAQHKDIKSLNQRLKGPIRNKGAGTKPMVYLDNLLEWWNHLAVQQQELSNQRDGVRLSAEAQHNYGRDGTAAPEIGGGVKKRRRDKRT
jgi:hypothetical protein